MAESRRLLYDTIQYLKKHDIILLTETRTRTTQALQQHLPEYVLYAIDAPSGLPGEGLCCAVRHTLRFTPNLWHQDTEYDNLWVQLTPVEPAQRPLFIGLCYIPHDTSNKLATITAAMRFQQLTATANVAATHGSVLLAGDFNARIGNLDDSWVSDYDSSIPSLRDMADGVVSGHSAHLMDLSRHTNLVITTGRVHGDMPAQSSFLRDNRTGRLDHVLVSHDLWGQLYSLHVDTRQRHSDHFPLVTQFTYTTDIHSAPPDRGVPVCTYRWDHDKHIQYVHAITGCQQQLDQCIEAAAAGDCNMAADALHCAVATAAAATMRYHRPRVHGTVTRFPPWFDAECQRQKRITRHATRAMPAQRALLRGKFQQLLRGKKRAYRSDRLLQLTQSAKKNLHALFVAARPQQPTLPPDLQTPAGWDALLQSLTAPVTNPIQQVPPSPFTTSPAEATELNLPFDHYEVELALKQLHNGRSAALLGHTSEFLRYAKLPADEDNPEPPHVLAPALTAAFNTAFSTGTLPDSWQTSLVTPVFKRGDKTDATAYRPIAVGEPLARLYAVVLNNRLIKYTEDRHLRAATQAGFRPRLSTTHQLFTLQHLIDKQRHAKQPLYTCFVDLKSAYDKVQRPLLWQKL